MPSWIMHVDIVQNLNTKFKLEDPLFLLGNVLPDMGNGYTIEHPSIQVPYRYFSFGKFKGDRWGFSNVSRSLFIC